MLPAWSEIAGRQDFLLQGDMFAPALTLVQWILISAKGLAFRLVMADT
jgi:hypothetical protein